MKCLSEREYSEILTSIGLASIDLVKKGESDWFESDMFQTSVDAGAKAHISYFLVETNKSPLLVHVFDKQVWPSSCNQFLASFVWKNLSLTDDWLDEPFIKFELEDKLELGALIGLCFLSFWSLVVIDQEGRSGWILDHDGRMFGIAQDEKNLEIIVSQFRLVL